MTSYNDVSQKFRKFHKNSFNCLLHLITTPLCILAIFWLVEPYFSAFPIVFSLAWTAALLAFSVPLMFTLMSALTLAALCVIAPMYSQSLATSIVAFIVGYVGQELAHWSTGEGTYQDSYTGSGDFVSMFMEHCLFLLPLIWDAAYNCEFPLVALNCELNNVLWTDITDDVQMKDMIQIRHWTLEQGEAKKHTIHHWFENLPKPIYDAYDRLANSPDLFAAFRARFPENCYNVEILPGMNEIYQTAANHYSSDRVFYNKHVDGPWCFFPYCYVFRCLLALSPNRNIKTIFPYARSEGLLATGKAVAFDFNREIHYIAAVNPALDESRIALKLHYVVYPKCLAPIGLLAGWLTTKYDQIARWWFLQTLNPDNVATKSGTWMTLAVTEGVYRFHEIFGSNNVFYTFFALMVDMFYWPGSFIYLTSFVHYTHYIGTYYYRKNINYGCFKRTVVYFKALAVIQLVYIYLTNFEFSLVSLALIASGVGLASAAAAAIGVDRTYFGAELGYYEPKWITAFPYNTGIPHPMIVGAVMWLSGFGMQSVFREQYPFLIPTHVACYLTHCLQEQFDIHLKEKPKSN